MQKGYIKHRIVFGFSFLKLDWVGFVYNWGGVGGGIVVLGVGNGQFLFFI